MKLSLIFVTIFPFISFYFFSQVNITTSNYSQNFGTSAITTWTNNSTVTGWYVNDVSEFRGEANITAAAPSNTGGVYAYTCSGANDRKLGSRASGGTNTIYYGVRIKNTTGSTIRSVRVSYSAFQLSRAENNNNSNVLTFSYRVVSSPTTITDLTSGTYTNVTALNYTAPTNHPGPGTSNQVNGIPCTTSSSISSCIAVTIPNNGEIMLRWTDIDNSANDHHIAIDNIQASFSLTQTNCTVLLPIDLIQFDVNCDNSKFNLNWSTSSERNNDFFSIEASTDGVNFEEIDRIKGVGNSSKLNEYNSIVKNQNYNYFRLKQTDFDGTVSELQTIKTDCKENNGVKIYPNPTNGLVNIIHLERNSELNLFNSLGQIIFNENLDTETKIIDLSEFEYGVYFIQIIKEGKVETLKLVYQE